MTGNFIDDVIIENARVFSTNFSGREKIWQGKIINTEGTINFCVSIPDDIAQQMIEDGWAVRINPPRNEGDEASYFLPVEVKFKDRSRKPLPPKIYPHVYMYTGKKETMLDDESIGVLDGIEFKNIDLTIHPRIWEDDNGERRIKAYLLDGRFVVKESRIAAKYANWYSNSDDGEAEEVPFD